VVLSGQALAGGLAREKQTFSATAALSGSAPMVRAGTAMAVPDLFHLARGEEGVAVLRPMSIGISVVLLLIYAASLVFSLRTHKHLYAGEDAGTEEEVPPWSQKKAVLILLGSTVGVVVAAEFLVHAIEPAIKSFGLTHTFI